MFIRRLAMSVVSMCLLAAPATAWANAAPSLIDVSELSNGIVKVQHHDTAQSVNDKVKISKDNQHFYYSVKDHNRFPLQLGDGKYTITVLQHVADNKYRAIESKEVNVTVSSPQAVFLQPIQMIYWNDKTNAVAKARELTNGLKNDRDKVQAIYNYVIQNVQYDYEKANRVTSEYIPSVDSTLNERQGICYDYAALFAAMLRSEGIPAKLVMGRKNDIPQYHAWNEIYLKETNEWITVDTTYDSIMVKGTKKPTMIKNKSEYVIEKQF
ncbi:transglutaminase-like domain-containing protein [Brevibacillus borstelensis]|uniref:transglutaminase-like domain-containing protein n=1 Tax=Brevibacillus borstelensis TaxID=45462 RepID=UPI0030BF099E